MTHPRPIEVDGITSHPAGVWSRPIFQFINDHPHEACDMCEEPEYTGTKETMHWIAGEDPIVRFTSDGLEVTRVAA